MAGSLVIVSGPPGAGKSTVARALADRRSPSVHLHADDVFHWIRQGFVPPWLPASRAQNDVVAGVQVAAATAFAAGGYAVLHDGVVGPWYLEPFVAAAAGAGVALDYVVLRPDEGVATARATSRTTPDALVDEDPVRFMHARFADLGQYEPHAVDSSGQTVEETVAVVEAGLAAARFRL